MAITQVVDIEMLEKLPDGNYKKKNPETKASQVIANNGQTVEQHLADDNAIKHKAKTIALEDTSNKFTATNVEGAMTELFTNVSDGKQAVGTAITDVDDSVVIPTDPTFGDLASAISGISTGKKWASGVSATGIQNQKISVTGLEFDISAVMVYFPNSYGLTSAINDNGAVKFSYSHNNHVNLSSLETRSFSFASGSSNGYFHNTPVNWIAFE